MAFTVILSAFPLWVKSGADRNHLGLYPSIALIALFLVLFLPYLSGGTHQQRCSRVRETVRGLQKDPLFFLGAALLTLLIIQWWNGGKVRILEPSTGKISFSPEFIEWMPGVVDPVAGWDMVVWFFPAVTAMIIIRRCYPNPDTVRKLFWCMTINASFLAIFGLLVPVLPKNALSWLSFLLPEERAHAFATFAYPNYAGIFFILHLGIASGLFFHYYKNKKRASRFSLKAPTLAVVMLLLFFAVHRTGCRSAILYSWILSGCILVYLLITTFKSASSHGHGKKKTVIIILCFLVVMISVHFFHFDKALHAELSTMSHLDRLIKEQLKNRFWSLKAAARIWLDHPLFGVGGNGIRHYLPYYAEIPKKGYICTSNIHNDFMQYLAELGIVGLGLMLGIFSVLVIGMLRSSHRKSPWFIFTLTGLLGVLFQSLIDAPFRSPPIIISFAVVLASLGIDETKNKAAWGISTSSRQNGSVHFYLIVGLFAGIVIWWASAPLRKAESQRITETVGKEYRAGISKPAYGNVIPSQSRNISPALSRSLIWAVLLNDTNRDAHRLSAKINFDLYRQTGAGSFLKKALRSSLLAKRHISRADLAFVKTHTAILDALGYYLEESFCLCEFERAFPDKIKSALILKEFLHQRPHLSRHISAVKRAMEKHTHFKTRQNNFYIRQAF